MLIKRFVLLVSCLYLVLFNLSQANPFDSNVQKIVGEYSYDIPNSFIATIQGTFKNTLAKMKNLEKKAKIEEPQFHVQGMEDKFSGMKYYIHSHVKKHTKQISHGPKSPTIYKTYYEYSPKKAPVMFYIAGLFDDAGSGNSKSVINEYIDLGFHVIAIANPLSIEFLSAKPKYELGNVQDEAKVVLSIMESVLKDLKGRSLIKNNEIHLSGISHGGFISSVVAALDAQSKKPLINKTVTIYSAPYNLLKAAKYLDLACSESTEYSDIGIFSLAKKILNLIKIKLPGDIQDDQAQAAKGIVSNVVFKKSMTESLIEYDKLTRRMGIPTKKKELKKWKAELTFMGYYQKYAKATFKQLMSGDGAIKKWLDIYSAKTSKDIRVVVARDDFLNDSYDWDYLSYEQAVILEHGGHMGYVSSKSWFKKFMTAVF